MSVIFGITYDDKLTGTGSTDTIFGLSGNDTLSGLGGDDVLLGGDGTDTLNGGAGADLLDGGADADKLVGGAGNDTYLFASGDTITENINGGVDTVVSSIFFDLSVDPDLENLRLDGADNIAASGNNANNLITGNDGDNLITGEGGQDKLGGGAGTDTLSGGSGNDTFWFQDTRDSEVGPGRDIITDFNSGTGTKEKIDVSGIDANTTIAGDQAFTFVGDLNGATPKIGEIGFDTDNGANTTVVSMNVNGGAVDSEIELTGLHVLTASMFIL
jgi:Ca2+-binding RTX toxin-like protein